jgi:hypothetical protein
MGEGRGEGFKRATWKLAYDAIARVHGVISTRILLAFASTCVMQLSTRAITFMKKSIQILIGTVLVSTLISVQAQMGGGGMGMGGMGGMSGSMAKLFGDNNQYTATMQIQVTVPNEAEPLTISGKTAYDNGRSRFEMDMSQMKGLPPGTLDQMKAMGMDKSVIITHPDKKMAYTVYPGMKAYMEMPTPQVSNLKSNDNIKVETTELGKETVDGHPCVKNKAVITDDKGTKHEATVWNATDLKNFPVKIEMTERAQPTIVMFKDVKLGKPEAGQFDPPSAYKKLTMEELMQEMMSKQPGRGAGPGGPGGAPRGQ